jgi:hypothetical protein
MKGIPEPPWMNRRIGLFAFLAPNLDPLINTADAHGFETVDAIGERMARSSTNLCCRYFLYSRADDGTPTNKQAIAIPT